MQILTSASSSWTDSDAPLPSPKPYRLSASAKRYKYLRRIFRFQQMDFEFALWQMIYLFVSPQKVYRNFQYRKQTKDQFARDDPAFLVLLSFCLCASSIGFSIFMGISFLGFFIFLLWVIFVDCISVGLVIATLFWFITNKYLRKPTCVDQDVEWGYAFDIHLNAFFPVLIILHVFQLILNPVIQGWNPFVDVLLGNFLWVIAISYYVYITFLGYTALPILRNTQVLLYPIIAVIVFYMLTLIFQWNMWRLLLGFYETRIV